MISPVLYDRPFKLEAAHTSQVNYFVNLGQQRGNKGLTHVLFLRKSIPEGTVLTVGEATSITGYCSYRYVLTNGRLVGVLLCAFTPSTVCTPTRLSVANYGNLPHKFEPVYALESLGLFAFTADDSSILVLPKVMHENAFLVKDTQNGS